MKKSEVSRHVLLCASSRSLARAILSLSRSTIGYLGKPYPATRRRAGLFGASTV